MVEPERIIQSKVAVMQPCSTEGTGVFKEKILDKLQLGRVRIIVCNDLLIKKRGKILLERGEYQKNPKVFEHVRTKMRELGRLVLHAQNIDHKVRCLEDLLIPERFDCMV